jgi:hypothetical protein
MCCVWQCCCSTIPLNEDVRIIGRNGFDQNTPDQCIHDQFSVAAIF